MKKKTWQLVEQHGLWCAYEGELPAPEAFQTHRRPPQTRFRLPPTRERSNVTRLAVGAGSGVGRWCGGVHVGLA